LKNRLEDIGRSGDWLSFLDEFMIRHKGKKRLLQMVELLRDGTFEISEMRPSKKRKLSKKDRDDSD